MVNFAAGGVATPADAALMMQMGVDGVFVGSGIFKSGNPSHRARAIVQVGQQLSGLVTSHVPAWGRIPTCVRLVLTDMSSFAGACCKPSYISGDVLSPSV